MREERALSLQIDQPHEAFEKQITDSVRQLFEILGRPGRQNVLYAKDKKELKELAQ